MVIANQLRNKNRAEYLLYLWQVEDILRAYGCDFERLKNEYLIRFETDETTRENMEEWYRNLCEMMHTEGLLQKGHLSISRTVFQELLELHLKLSDSSHFPYYREMYYKVLPYIVELRSKGNHREEPELLTCFELLYGVMLLRLSHKEVAPATEKAVADISTLLGQLSDYYFKDRKEPIVF